MADSIGRLNENFRRISLRVQRIVCSGINNFECKLKGVSIGRNVYFWGHAIIRRATGSKITIGDNVRINSSDTYNLIGVWRRCVIATMASDAMLTIGDGCGLSGVAITAYKSVSIGANVLCGANVTITDSDWHHDDKRSGGAVPVIIHDRVWIGMNCIILKGVTIGENSVIGAGSVVAGNIPSNVVAGGNPCRVIRQLSLN